MTLLLPVFFGSSCLKSLRVMYEVLIVESFSEIQDTQEYSA